MSKKTSAKSKGYRKAVQKKPYLTKKDILISVAIVAAIVLVVVLFNLFYDDGSLKVKDGAVQSAGENSLILNVGSAKAPHYFKVGQLAEIEGYSMTSNASSTDENILEYVYTPESDSNIDLISVNAYAYDASVFSSSAEQVYAASEDMDSTELQTIEHDGHSVSYLTFRVLETEADETSEETEEAEETAYVQALHAYVSVETDRCIYILVRNDVQSPEEYVDDAILVDAMQQVLGALSYETK